MNELEEKLGSILNDPNMMQQIMSMAQSLGQTPPQASQAPAQSPQEASGAIHLDPKMLQSLLGLAKQGNVDPNQQTLLRALSPYLSRERVSKLERAMRAARLAGAASSFLNAGGLQMLTGR